MTIRRRRKTLVAGTSVALATAGLSSCIDGGAVDPPPPPLECNTVDNGESLTATAVLTGREMTVTIRNASSSTWASVAVTAVAGGTVRPVHPAEPLVFVIDLTDATVTRGSFNLSGTLEGFGGTRCGVARGFTFTIGSGGVVVASTLDLPLPARQQAHIGLVGREGDEVLLEATTPFTGRQAVSWSVTGGTVLAQDGNRLRWRLPTEPGLYQAELVIDYGPQGLSFDTLALEVS